MNAGAWGKDLGRFVVRATVIDQHGKEKILKKNRLGFGYRKSILQKGKYLLVEAVFRLRRGKKRNIVERIKKYLTLRKEKQPLGIPNAGSIFRNPPGKHAGQLLEQAGCKGMRIGDAQVSVKHANFIVNLGEAKARDVIKLMTRMQRRVKRRLESELKIMIKSAG
jgi:UDP-N-acetylmuramate dehydrogenase